MAIAVSHLKRYKKQAKEKTYCYTYILFYFYYFSGMSIQFGHVWRRGWQGAGAFDEPEKCVGLAW